MDDTQPGTTPNRQWTLGELALLNAERERLENEIRQLQQKITSHKILTRASFTGFIVLAGFIGVLLCLHYAVEYYCHTRSYASVDSRRTPNVPAWQRLQAAQVAKRRMIRFTPVVVLLIIMIRVWHEAAALTIGYTWVAMRAIHLIHGPLVGGIDSTNVADHDCAVLAEVIFAAIGVFAVVNPQGWKLRWAG
ncbi:hypothetical protein KVT40_007855 [Elsinoe batatas]|uniref:Uncharacterized protein n=1 Tax=Elsinoe batatas TaxID=2601811 RepID=A0A8K0L2V0_9PEZI|nr:hypothetical protein KVT40_007855 [Elsinoe batatas]